MSETTESVEVTSVRKDRRDGVTGEIKCGPTHRIHGWDQTWCGRKIKGLATWNRHASPEDVDCKACQQAVKNNRPRSWRRR